MNSGSLGNRQARQLKQAADTNQPVALVRNLTKPSQLEDNAHGQCNNGICQVAWKPVQSETKVSDNLVG